MRDILYEDPHSFLRASSVYLILTVVSCEKEKKREPVQCRKLNKTGNIRIT
jgi:hypothetical protein